MEKTYIYLRNGDVCYHNNVGKDFVLVECVSPFGNGTYDIISAIPLITDEDGEEVFGNADMKWFCGVQAIHDYLKGAKTEWNDLEDLCHTYLDEKVEVKEVEQHPIVDIFYTGGGIYCGILKVKDGWFMGEVNSYGAIYKTYKDAIESCPCEQTLVRYIEDQNEQIAIWVELYSKYADFLDEEGTDLHADMWDALSQLESSLYHDITKC